MGEGQGKGSRWEGGRSRPESRSSEQNKSGRASRKLGVVLLCPKKRGRKQDGNTEVVYRNDIADVCVKPPCMPGVHYVFRNPSRFKLS